MSLGKVTDGRTLRRVCLGRASKLTSMKGYYYSLKGSPIKQQFCCKKRAIRCCSTYRPTKRRSRGLYRFCKLPEGSRANGGGWPGDYWINRRSLHCSCTNRLSK